MQYIIFMAFCSIAFEHTDQDEAEQAFANSKTSSDEKIMAIGNEYKAQLSNAGFCLLRNYNACLKIIGESA